MSTQTILLIRHAEKPNGDGVAGVDTNGANDDRSLTPRGWQRAGAWAELFAPSLAEPALPRPTAIFASAPISHHHGDDEGSKSRRPLETITPLAAKLGIGVNQTYSKGNESELAQAISALEGVTLVCWQHEVMLEIARALVPAPAGLPASWPPNCFNVILKFSRGAQGAPWKFEQIVPALLDGDQTSRI
jgi:hypothetical protein